MGEFKSSRHSLEDDTRPGRHVTVATPETVNKVHDIGLADRRVTEYSWDLTGKSSVKPVRVLGNAESGVILCQLLVLYAYFSC